MLLAGVDIGTLTCRLLIARVTAHGRVEEVHAERRILRLGEGVDGERRLLPAAMARVTAALRDWREVIRRHTVQAETAVATSAVRNAVNRQEFLSLVSREAGFEVEVLSGEEEARRTMLGIRSGLPPALGPILGLDIGGGSTEFIYDRSDQAPAVRSIDLGVVRLTERTLRQDPPTPEEVRAACDIIAEQTRAVRSGFTCADTTTLVGTAGTITTLAAMIQRLPSYERARVHNYRLSLDAVREMERDLVRRCTTERRGLPGLEAGREDVIIAGALILRVVMETWGFTECLTSDLGLREGIVLDLASRLRSVERET